MTAPLACPPDPDLDVHAKLLPPSSNFNLSSAEQALICAALKVYETHCRSYAKRRQSGFDQRRYWSNIADLSVTLHHRFHGRLVPLEGAANGGGYSPFAFTTLAPPAMGQWTPLEQARP